MVRYVRVDPQTSGQRVDNYLIKVLKGVPKSRLYRALRTGEIRVNRKRVGPDYRLSAGDLLRVPPLVVPSKPVVTIPAHVQTKVNERVLIENEHFLVLDKPYGMAVHAGSQTPYGVIEILRAVRSRQRFLDLVHRLDRDTSGCLLIAKKRSALLKFHQLFVQHQVQKQYLAFVQNPWAEKDRDVNLPLVKHVLKSGEWLVQVGSGSRLGKPARTLFYPLKRFKEGTLVSVFPVTGRTHQIRVHAAAIGHPIAGDEKYGDKTFNRLMVQAGLRRLFLHAASLTCQLDTPNERVEICSMLELSLHNFLKTLTPT